MHLSLGQSIILLHRSSIGRQTPSPENTKSKIGRLNASFCCRFITAPHVNSSSLQEVKSRSWVKFLSFLTNEAINIGEDYKPRNNDSPTLSLTRVNISASLKTCLQLISLSNTKLCFPKSRDWRGAYWNINDQNKKIIFNFQKEWNLWGGSDRWIKRAWLDRQTSNWGEKPFLPLCAVGVFVSQALFFFFNKSTWNSLKSRASVISSGLKVKLVCRSPWKNKTSEVLVASTYLLNRKYH